jgi:hypothetical protein
MAAQLADDPQPVELRLLPVQGAPARCAIFHVLGSVGDVGPLIRESTGGTHGPALFRALDERAKGM